MNGERARQLFENIMRQRLDRIGASASFVLSSVEEENAVARSLQHLLRAKPTAVLIASTTAPAGPDDVIGRAMVRAGCHIERFLAPVEPGNLFLLGYKDDVPDSVRSRLLPLRETQCRGFDAAAHAGALPCLGLGSRLPRAWRIAGLNGLLCGAPFRGARGRYPRNVRLFFVLPANLTY